MRFPRIPRMLLLGVSLPSAIVLWGVLSLRVAGNESSDTHRFAATDPSSLKAVAFIEHDASTSSLVLLNAAPDVSRRIVATFERINGHQVTGRISPNGARAAVVHPAPHDGSYLSIVDLGSRVVTRSPALVDNDTSLAWSADSTSVIAVTSTHADATGRLGASILEIDAITGETRTLATFPSVLAASPVGFAAGGEAILVVVVDQAGTALWSVAGPEPELVTQLSGGRTRDWVLSPDGAMLAFVELRSGADVPAVGRVVFTATGAPAAEFDHLAAHDGAVWKPGSAVAGFGGPGGNLSLVAPDAGYLVPRAWSPDGSALVARVVQPSLGGETSTESWQILADAGTGDARIILFEKADEASFLGWARTSLLSSSSSSGATPWP